MTKVLRISGASYGKNQKVLSDALGDGFLHLIILTHEVPERQADASAQPLPIKDGICIIPLSAAERNKAFSNVVAQEKTTGGQMGLRYAVNSMGYYLPEFGAARLIRVNPLAVDDKGLIDMVAFAPKDLEQFGYNPEQFEFVRDIYTQGKDGPAIAAVEPGSRMIVTGPASDNTDILGAMNVVVGPKDLAALEALFALAQQRKMSVTQLVKEVKVCFEQGTAALPGHPPIDLTAEH
jgi:hypothetical protein